MEMMRRITAPRGADTGHPEDCALSPEIWVICPVNAVPPANGRRLAWRFCGRPTGERAAFEPSEMLGVVREADWIAPLDQEEDDDGTDQGRDSPEHRNGYSRYHPLPGEGRRGGRGDADPHEHEHRPPPA